MTNGILVPLLLSSLAGFGVFLIFAAFAVPRAALRRLQGTGAGPRVVGVAEAGILEAAITDLSRRIKPEGDDLLGRLRRSGWIYGSLPELYARRMYTALIFMITALAVSVALDFVFAAPVVPLGSAVLTTLGAVYGFWLPERTINAAIRRRRERLLKEMGFGLERIALFLASGADIADALAQTRNVGLFGEACGRLASSLSMGRSILEATEDVRKDLPHTPAFDEFLGMVTISIQKGQTLAGPFRSRARAMRGRLKLAIVEEANRAKIKVTLLTSIVILLASLIVTIVPTLILLTSEGVI
jgi:Flp pilus assembly protein TadB